MEATGVGVLDTAGEIAAGESPAGGATADLGGSGSGNGLEESGRGAVDAGVGATSGDASPGVAASDASPRVAARDPSPRVAARDPSPGVAARDASPGVIVVGASDEFERVAALAGALLGELAGLSLEGAGRGPLRALVAATGRVRAGADAAEARVVQALGRLDDGEVDAVEVLRRNAGSSQREARRRKRRAEALEQMPRVAGALATGEISSEHADALARAAAATSAEAVDADSELLAQVAAVPADRAGRHIQEWTQRRQDPFDLHEQHLRQRRRRRLNFGDGEDGMLMAHAAFDRVLGAQFRSLINGIADRIWRAEGGRDNPDGRSAEQRRLDALAIAVGLEPPPAPPVPAGRPGEPGNSPTPPAPADRAGEPGKSPTPPAPAGRPSEPGNSPTPPAPSNGAAPAASPQDNPPAHTGDLNGGNRRAGTGTPPAGAGAPPPDNPPAHTGDAKWTTARDGRSGSGDAVSTSESGGDGDNRADREPGSEPQPQPVAVTPRHQIVIVASADVVTGADPQGRCEIAGVGPIPRAELERLACDAELFGLLFSGDGEPLWHGRGERTATDAQRRALVARDGGCVLCADEPARCEAHHVEPWAKPAEGPTDIDNLALLCGTCHRRLHNHRRVLTRSPDGTWTTAPDPRYVGRQRSRPPDSTTSRTGKPAGESRSRHRQTQRGPPPTTEPGQLPGRPTATGDRTRAAPRPGSPSRELRGLGGC